MKIIISGKNIEITEALRNIVEKKLAKLDKFFNPDIIAHVTLSVEKNRQKMEATIPFSGVILRAEESNDDMYVSIDAATDKLERQLRKQKTKLQRREQSDSLRFQYIPENDVPDKDEARIVKTKKFAIKPMSPEEAVLQMELLGHNFFVFENSDNNDVDVVYKRKDGNFGIIEPEY